MPSVSRTGWTRLAAATAALGCVGALAGAASAHHARQTRPHERTAQHVLLLSVDGLHQSDLAYYVKRHPSSALAALTRRGVEFTHAETPVPSDLFPGMVGQVTRGNPRAPASTTTTAGTMPCCRPGRPTVPARRRVPK
jgi:hypothetical protein